EHEFVFMVTDRVVDSKNSYIFGLSSFYLDRLYTARAFARQGRWIATEPGHYAISEDDGIAGAGCGLSRFGVVGTGPAWPAPRCECPRCPCAAPEHRRISRSGPGKLHQAATRLRARAAERPRRHVRQRIQLFPVEFVARPRCADHRRN